ncbi:MAG: hypothetical protein DRO87_08525 [Candidatus Thorarchaeota archaeon]|nr:MAG: hypothetical protein DRO87_08525 [Candidatus Thorarchaeota archaeon]
MKSKAISWIVFIIMCLVLLVAPALVKAEGVTVKMPDGQEIPVSNLSSQERYDLMKLLDKVSEDKKMVKAVSAQQVMDMANHPERLDAWRKVITGTIKDICNDLNVTVNEFIKTPVGMGVAGLIVYKVAGKDVLSNFMDFFILAPFWVFSMALIMYLRSKYLGTSITYRSRKEIGTNKRGKPMYEYSDPVKVLNYPWDSDDARVAFSCALFGSAAIITLVTLVVILS